jgi:hypothetical protein
MNADPEDARSPLGGKESISAHANFKYTIFDLPQTFGDGFDLLGCLFADELQGKVQRFRTHPAGIERESFDAFDKA